MFGYYPTAIGAPGLAYATQPGEFAVGPHRYTHIGRSADFLESWRIAWWNSAGACRRVSIGAGFRG
jgi:hypothetical protein